jgi:hypothetical protein
MDGGRRLGAARGWITGAWRRRLTGVLPGLLARSSIVEVKWRGQERRVYSQDPPFFILNPGAPGVSVLARYTNGEIAALVAEHGRGRVGLVGPHPEATSAWFERAHLSQGSAMATDLALDLVDSVMR